MLKINKLTDYAMVILCELSTETIHSATSISQLTHIPLATTNKILKILVKSGICLSKGGKQGGFFLLKSKEKITFLDVINSIEGNPMHITSCTSSCQLKKSCKITQ